MLRQKAARNISILLLLFFAILSPIALLSQSLIDTSEELSHPSEQIIPEIGRTLTSQPPLYLYIFIAALLMLAAIRVMATGYYRDLFISTFNLKTLIQMSNENRFGFNTPSLLLDVLSISMYGILVQQLAFPASPDTFGWVVTFTAIIYFSKLLVIHLFSFIFFGRGEALIHVLLHLLFVRVTGLILFPVLLVALYQNVTDAGTIFLIVAYILIFLYIIWVGRLFINLKSVSVSGTFYLFLYLCTIELSPLFVLAKGF